MDYRHRVISDTKEATDKLFRYARAMPEDKLTWKVEGKGKSALEQLQECATSPVVFTHFLKGEEMSEESFLQLKNEQDKLLTIDACEKVALENNERLYEGILSIAESEVDNLIRMPVPSRREVKFTYLIGLQYWHLIYHYGQICFIQTLYGDWENY